MAQEDYDGYAPIHTCTCGCGLVIGDGNWAAGRRYHGQLIPPQRRYTSPPPPLTTTLSSTRR